MNILLLARDVTLTAGGIALFIFLLYRVVRWARARTHGAYVLGALIIPLGGIGNVGDPDFRMVDEAKQLKQQEEDDPGDPPDPDSEPS